MKGSYKLYRPSSMNYEKVFYLFTVVCLMKGYSHIFSLYIPVDHFHYYHTIPLEAIVTVYYNLLDPAVSLRAQGWVSHLG